MEQIALDDVLVRIGEPAVDALHEAFRKPSSVLEHRRIMSLIGKIASARSQPVLVEASADADRAIRAAAAAGLGKLATADREARRQLLALLTDDDWSVRLRVVLALGDANAPEDLDTLAAALRDPHFAVRLAAAEVLGDRGGPAVPAISEQLEHRRTTLTERLVCFQALGRTGHPAAATHIEPFLINSSPLVRAYAAQAYGRAAPVSDAPLCSALLQEETDANVRRALREALKALEERAAKAGGL